MTPEEIRRIELRCNPYDGHPLLRELAAQLAELNESLRAMVEFQRKGEQG